MKGKIKLFSAFIIASILISGCGPLEGVIIDPEIVRSGGGGGQKTNWVKMINPAPRETTFSSVAIDNKDNIYVAGCITGPDTYTFDNFSVNAPYYGTNAVLAKYNSMGLIQWVKTAINGNDSQMFRSVTVDDKGNIYAVGFQNGTGDFEYATGQPLTGKCGSNNAIIVKYNPQGVVLWNKTVSGLGTVSAGEFSDSTFMSVAVDNSGGVYACGTQRQKIEYQYGESGNPATMAKGSAYYNPVIVKYNAETGVTEWAKTISKGEGSYCRFSSVAVDNNGGVYAAGNQSSDAVFDYGSGDITAPHYETNGVLVKYDADGNAKWAITASGNSQQSMFSAVTVDSYGDVYIAGFQNGWQIYKNADGSTLTVWGNEYNKNSILIKFNKDGKGQWGKVGSPSSSNTFGQFGPDILYEAVFADGQGNIYTGGGQQERIDYHHDGLKIAAASEGSNAVVARYTRSGAIQGARTLTKSVKTDGLAGGIGFYSIAVDSTGAVYCAGSLYGSGDHDYDNGSGIVKGTVVGSSAVLVKYSPNMKGAGSGVPPETAFFKKIHQVYVVQKNGEIVEEWPANESRQFNYGFLHGDYNDPPFLVPLMRFMDNGIGIYTLSLVAGKVMPSFYWSGGMPPFDLPYLNEGLSSKITVTPSDVKFTSFSGFSTIGDSSTWGYLLGYGLYESIKNPEAVKVWFFYVDKNATVKGSDTEGGLTLTCNMNLQKGWNIVLVKATPTTVSYTTGTPPSSYKWQLVGSDVVF